MSTFDTTTAASFTSPKQRLHNAVSSRAETGQISATDKTALDSAIDTIDASLSSSTSSSTSARLDPSQMKSRIDDLISKAVSDGTLTDEQATTLKSLFSRGGQDGQAGMSGAGGPPPGPPPAGGPPPSASSDSTSDDSSTQVADATTSSTDGTSASELLATFIKQLQSLQSQGGSYTAAGASGSGRVASALLLNFEV
jgi:hypothetical protein